MDRRIGLLDTTILIHSLTNDEWSEPATRLLEEIETGRRRVYVDALVVHEFTFVYRRYRKQADREEIATAILALLGWSGVIGSTVQLREAVARWQADPGLGFVDAYLAVRAATEGMPVYTVNVRDFHRQGVEVPDIGELTSTSMNDSIG